MSRRIEPAGLAFIRSWSPRGLTPRTCVSANSDTPAKRAPPISISLQRAIMACCHRTCAFRCACRRRLPSLRRLLPKTRAMRSCGAYEAAMLREVAAVCAGIPHHDLALQWDVCIEMVMWDGRWRGGPPFPGMEKVFADTLARLAANLIAASAQRPIAWMHMPVPIARYDDAFFRPLRKLHLDAGTELYLGLLHAEDGLAGAQRRIAAARKFAGRSFGVASECGIARGRTPARVRQFLEVYAAAAAG